MSDLKNDAGRQLPVGLQYVRTTPLFDQNNVPRGLLAAHRIAAGVWGRLSVKSGALVFFFEESPRQPHRLTAGDHFVIPPARPHRLTLEQAVTFVIEFYKAPA